MSLEDNYIDSSISKAKIDEHDKLDWEFAFDDGNDNNRETY
jgi:hypothetical protein